MLYCSIGKGNLADIYFAPVPFIQYGRTVSFAEMRIYDNNGILFFRAVRRGVSDYGKITVSKHSMILDSNDIDIHNASLIKDSAAVDSFGLKGALDKQDPVVSIPESDSIFGALFDLLKIVI